MSATPKELLPASDGTVLGEPTLPDILVGVPAADLFGRISGRTIKVEVSDITGRQRRYQAPIVKSTTTTTGTTPKDDAAESGDEENLSDSADETADEFFYCYQCQDAWDLDDDAWWPNADKCPFCGGSEVSIIEMRENEPHDIFDDDLPFFHQ